MFCSLLVVLLVVINFQASSAHVLFKRTPQQLDIQSIRQRQISPDITVVDVVVNEPMRGRYPNQNQYNQPIYPTVNYQRPSANNNFNYYPNGQYQNIPNRQRQPEIHVIEVVQPIPGSGMNNNFQPWQQNPSGLNQLNTGNVYPNNPFFNNNGNRPNRPNRKRPYKPQPDFYIPQGNDPTSTEPSRNKPQGQRENKPKPSDESSEEEKYIFDAGEGTITGYTKDNFPIIPLNKNDIRK